ncbi:MAG TPA: DNA-directed DNA polymerase I [Candidatus Korarchaeota archaeon]|nr:DNA-directed DNA polymerase I [Candidatus Korarchaeota archaeon]
MPNRKGVLLSIFYSGEDKSAVMKFYDPDTGEVFLVRDNTGHKPYLLTDAPPDSVDRLLSPNLAARLFRVSKIRKYDVLRDRYVDLTKVEAKDPLAIGGSPRNMRDELTKRGFTVWEAKIKYYDCYVYDRDLVPGCVYEIEEEGNLERVTNENELPEEFRDLDPRIQEILSSFIPLFDEPSPPMRSVAVDIEVLSPLDRMPDPSKPDRPVAAVAMVDSEGEREVHVLSRGGYIPDELPNGAKLVKYENEGRLIRSVLDRISEYPLVFTYNGDNFDFPYLARRARELGVSDRPIRLERDRALLDTGMHVDLYKLFSNRSIQVYVFNNKYLGYTLDEVAEALLGERKIELGTRDFYSVEVKDLAEYCLQDAELTYKLGNIGSGELIRLLFLLSRISKMSLEEVSRQGVSSWIRNMIFFEYRRRNWLIPEQDEIKAIRGERTYSQAIIKGKKYMGAIVLEPEPGVHFNVAVMDFASLYPSIIGRWKVSFETINCPHESCRSNRPVEELPHWICKKGLGIIPYLIQALRDVRVRRYKRRAKEEKDEKMREWFDTVQRSLKVFLNASYGVFGYENFPLYSPPAAEMITALARKAMLLSIKEAKKLGLRVIYGDTDSLFIKGATEREIEELERVVESKLGIDLELDKWYRYVVLSKLKKNYLGVTKDGVIDVKGLLGKKRNIPRFVKKAFEEVLEILRNVETPEDFEEAKKKVAETIKSYVKRLESEEFELEELAFRTMLSKSLDSYKKTTPQHVKVARILENMGKRVVPGQVIRYVKVKGRDGVMPLELASKAQIDKGKYLEIMKTTFEQILDSLDMDFDSIVRERKSTSLEEFF